MFAGGSGSDAYAAAASFAGLAATGLATADDGMPYSTNELNAPEYSTDDFRMYSFKVRYGVMELQMGAAGQLSVRLWG